MKIKEIISEAGFFSGVAKGLAPNIAAAYDAAEKTGDILQDIHADPAIAAQWNQERKLFQTMKQRAVMKNGISVDEIDKLVAQSGKYPDAKQHQAAVNRFVGLLQQQNVNVTDRTLGGTSGGMTKQQFAQSRPTTAPAPAAAAQAAPAAPAANAGASMTAKMSAASTPQSTAQALRQRRALGLPESKAQKKIIRHK